LPLPRDADTLTVPYLVEVYKKHGHDALIMHLSNQLTSKRMGVLCTALGVSKGDCTARSIARAVEDIAGRR